MAKDTLPLMAGEQPEDDADQEGERRRMDPELRALAAVLRILDGVTESARGRMIAYLADRFRQGKE